MGLYTGSEQNLRDYGEMRSDAKKRARRAFSKGNFAEMKEWSRKAAEWTVLMVHARDIRREHEELNR